MSISTESVEASVPATYRELVKGSIIGWPEGTHASWLVVFSGLRNALTDSMLKANVRTLFLLTQSLNRSPRTPKLPGCLLERHRAPHKALYFLLELFPDAAKLLRIQSVEVYCLPLLGRHYCWS